MKDLRTFAGREMMMLWLGGAVVAVGLLFAARAMARPIMRTELNQFARERVLQQDRAREVDSLYSAYARAHPDDSAAQRSARLHRVSATHLSRGDSIALALVQRGALDTAFNPGLRGVRSTITRASGLLGAYAISCIALSIPCVLAVVTLWWAVARRRLRDA